MRQYSILFVLPILLGIGIESKAPQKEMFQTKVLLEKDISEYAGKDMMVTVRELTLQPAPRVRSTGIRALCSYTCWKEKWKWKWKEYNQGCITLESFFRKFRTNCIYRPRTLAMDDRPGS